MDEKDIYLIKRIRKGIKQSDIAKELRCSQSLISRWEKDVCNMSDDKIDSYKRYIDKRK